MEVGNTRAKTSQSKLLVWRLGGRHLNRLSVPSEREGHYSEWRLHEREAIIESAGNGVILSGCFLIPSCVTVCVLAVLQFWIQTL